jgi:phosphate transport system protein
VAAELRRGYHDRLAAVHDQVSTMVRSAASAVSLGTDALLEGDVTGAAAVAMNAADLSVANGAVEREVFDLVATQAPVARDLRLLLASLRIAHEVELSGALAANIAARASLPHDADVLTPALRALLYSMGAESAGLMDRAGKAYAALDDQLAVAVAGSGQTVRAVHRAFLGELFALPDGPVEPVVDLGIVARCFERIADHALEMADRVRFVVAAEAGSVGDGG